MLRGALRKYLMVETPGHIADQHPDSLSRLTVRFLVRPVLRNAARLNAEELPIGTVVVAVNASVDANVICIGIV